MMKTYMIPVPYVRVVLSFDPEATFRSTYRFDKLTALRLSKGRLSTGGPSSGRGLARLYGAKEAVLKRAS